MKYDAEVCVKLLQRAKETLWNGVGDNKGCHDFICCEVDDADEELYDGNALEEVEDIVLRIDKYLNSAYTMNAFLKEYDDRVFVQNKRYELIDQLIKEYKDEIV